MKISAIDLARAAEETLKRYGETPENAKNIARCLVKADMRGIPTHGAYLLKVIAMRAEAKQLSLPTLVSVVSDNGATAIIDGGDGIGMVAGLAAVELAVDKARQYGIGAVLIRNTNNVGALSNYTRYAASTDMIGIMSCNAAPAMAPWGGAEQYLGTNPISIAIPADGLFFTADMATSVVARGKIRSAGRNGAPIPAGWAFDKDGVPTTDAKKALEGTLMPMGGPKGSALAMAADVISGLLSGSAYGPSLKSFHEPDGPTGVGASCIVIDISRFMDPAAFKALFSAYIKTAKSMKKAEGFSEILIAGEIEDAKEKQSMAEGIDMDDAQASGLNELLKSIGLKPLIAI